jgi:ElaB/YqjD/DUF883 family membrane-anchored ribosome-binding protein
MSDTYSDIGGSNSGIPVNPDDAKNPDTARIQQEIAATRSEMSGTLEELQQKLSPAALKEQARSAAQDMKENLKTEVKTHLSDAKDAVHDATIGKVSDMARDVSGSVAEQGRSLLELVKENPVPAAMAGVGLAWLLVNARASSRRTYPRRSYYAEQAETRYRASEFEEPGAYLARRPENGTGKLSQKAGTTMRKVRDRASDMTRSVQRSADDLNEGASQLAQRTQASLRNARQSVGDRAGRMAGQVKQQGQRLGDLYRDNPMLVGAAVVLVGAVVGMTLPTTEREARLMGPARDQLVRKAEGVARGALEQVENVAKESGDRI